MTLTPFQGQGAGQLLRRGYRMCTDRFPVTYATMLSPSIPLVHWSYMVAGRPYRGDCWYKPPECMLGAWPVRGPGLGCPLSSHTVAENLGQGLFQREGRVLVIRFHCNPGYSELALQGMMAERLSPECWHHRHAPPCLLYVMLSVDGN